MNISFVPYTQEFIKPVSIGPYQLFQKTGKWLKLDLQGQTGWGEITSLLGMHHRSGDQVAKEISDLNIADFQQREKLDWTRPAFGLLENPKLSPQALFALESALLSLFKDQFIKDFNLQSPVKVPLGGLYIPDEEDNEDEWMAAINKWKEDGLSCVKIKVGRLDEEKEKAMLKFIDLNTSDEFRVRLDGNLKLAPLQLKSLLQSIRKFKVDYVEEPYKNLSKDLQLFSDFVLALDEHVETLSPENYPRNTRVLVIKPSKLFSLSGTIQLMKKSELAIIVSSTYESPIGLWAMAMVAAIGTQVAGLDTQKAIKPSSFINQLPVSDGNLMIPLNFSLNTGH